MTRPLSMFILPAAIIFIGMRSAQATDIRKSGFDFMQPATQALQKDDTQNPAMLWVKDGEISYHLVLAMDASGNRNGARGLLKALLDSNIGFADRAKAQQLATSWH